jgi:polar amino acid transport system substrate-binding protein
MRGSTTLGHILTGLFIVFFVSSGLGQETSLVVGTKPTAPFVIKNEDGTWSGISIELWRKIAEDLQVTYRFEERDIEGLLAGLQDGSLDVVAAALTITSDREKRVDFSHSFYSTGLTIAASPAAAGWWATLKRFLSLPFVEVIAALFLVLLAVGILVWLAERRANPDEFGGSILQGIGAGFWWSAVTMTTVGYGDKAPRSTLGRIFALVWMFVAVIIISGFTAAIASALTVGQLDTKVKSPQDLPAVRVGTVGGSTSAQYLEDNAIEYETFDTPLSGLEAIAEGSLDAFVYDAPIIRYLVKIHLSGRVRVLPMTFERQEYGIVLPEGSNLMEPLNRSLLEHIRSPEWQEKLEYYLGK